MTPTYVRGLLCTVNDGITSSNLDFMTHRAWDGYLCYNKQSDYSIINKLNNFSYEIIGCLSDSAVRDKEILIHGEIYGNFIPIIDKIISSNTVNELKSNIQELYRLDGSYCMVVRGKLGTICCRDPLGCKPLYIGKKDNSISISTQKSILLDSNFQVEDFIPGTAMILENDTLINSRNLSDPKNYSNYDADILLNLLRTSISSRIGSKKNIGISFSGGIDSSILIAIANEFTEIKAFNVRMKDSHDFENAKKLANLLGIDLIEIEPNKDNIPDDIPNIISLAEITRPMDVSIALGFYYVAKTAKEHNTSTLFVGQLADELFGGYARYIRTLSEESPQFVTDMMNSDVHQAYTKNFERDEKITSPFVDLFVPYASLPIVNFALNCPIEYKIDVANDVRKLILRSVAKKLKLPDEIIYQTKKAIHFSSGIDKVVKKALKNN